MELEAPDGLERIRIMMHDGFAGTRRPTQNQHIEANVHAFEKTLAGKEARGGVGDLLLLVVIDGGRGAFDIGARCGADFDDDERSPNLGSGPGPRIKQSN